MTPHNIHLTEAQLADRIEAEIHQPTPFELRVFRWLEKDIMRDLKRRAREQRGKNA